MSIIWMDGFDHYADDEDLLSDGVYAAKNAVTLSTARPRTGTRSLRVEASNEGGLRRTFGDNYTTVGFGFAFYINTLPGNNGSFGFGSFRDTGNNQLTTLMLSSAGTILVHRGSKEGPVIFESAQVVLPQSYQHFECRVTASNTVGAVEVRINGVTVVNLTGVNTTGSPTAQYAQVQWPSPGSIITGLPTETYFDDVFAWNTEGYENNDFIGDRKVFTLLPDSDGTGTGENDWLRSVGTTAFGILSNQPPLDDTEFLTAENIGDTQVVGFESLPAGVVSIAGIMTVTRLFKTDAGNAKVIVSAISDGVTEPGIEHALSQAPTYYNNVFDTDPDTGSAWVAASVDAVQMAFERTE